MQVKVSVTPAYTGMMMSTGLFNIQVARLYLVSWIDEVFGSGFLCTARTVCVSRLCDNLATMKSHSNIQFYQ